MSVIRFGAMLGRFLIKSVLPKKPLKKPANKRQSKPKRQVVVVSRKQQVNTNKKKMSSGGLTLLEFLRPNEPLRHLFEAYILDQRSPHTQRSYQADIKRFTKYLLLRIHQKQSEPRDHFDRRLFVQYKDFLLAEKLSPMTVDRHLATLKTFFEYLVYEEKIEKSPVQNVRFINMKKLSVTQGFSDQEVVRILKLPNPYTFSGALHAAVLNILFYCGLRRSELCELRTSQMTTERGHRVFRIMGKGQKERIVVVPPVAVKALDHYLNVARKDLKKDQPIFVATKNNATRVFGKPLDGSMIFYIVTKYAKQAGVQSKVSPHSCRATAISHARDKDVSDRSIQEFAGWASPDMITRYDKRKTAVDESAALSIQYEV